MPNYQIARIFLDEKSIIRRSPEVEQERAAAIYDLLESNHFAPIGDLDGPFHLHLRVEDRSRLVLDVRTTEDVSLREVSVSLVLLRRLIRDYFQICESYYDAIKKLSLSQIETIDMARRGLHDEGSNVLLGRLKEAVEVDFNTARRLFTLVCVLHIRG
jgi:uncharacterized protein (UPF0262 family)